MLLKDRIKIAMIWVSGYLLSTQGSTIAANMGINEIIAILKIKSGGKT